MTVNVPGASNWEPPKPLDKGWYTVRCDKAEKTQTRTGADAVSLQLRVTDGSVQDDGSDPASDPDKNTLFDYVVIDVEAYKDSKGYKLMQNKLMSMLKGFNVLNGDEFEIEDLVGAEADVWVKHSSDESGDIRAEVGKYKVQE